MSIDIPPPIDSRQLWLQDRIKEIQSRREEIQHRLEDINPAIQRSLVMINHGFSPQEPGNCAVAGVVYIPGYSQHIVTAQHATWDENGVKKAHILNEQSLTTTTTDFFPVPPDTAVSYLPYEGPQPALPVGVFGIGDVLSVYGRRHVGEGHFAPAPLRWGVVVGKVIDNNDGQEYFHMTTANGEPTKGDSGSLVIAHNQPIAPVVGVLRGIVTTKEWGRTMLFSTVPTGK